MLPEAVQWLKECPPARINITLYGASDETYARLCDNPRGFTQVVRGIRLLKEAGIAVKLNCSVTPCNADDLEQMFAFARAEGLILQATSYMFPPLRRDAAMVGRNDRFTPEEAARQNARIVCESMGRERFLGLMEESGSARSSGIEEDCRELPLEGGVMRCRAGRCSFWVTWDGRLLPCGMFPGEHADNVFEEGFLAAWQRVRETVAAIRRPAECSVCELRDGCKACAAMVLTETGGFARVPEYRCRMSKAVDGACRELAAQLRLGDHPSRNHRRHGARSHGNGTHRASCHGAGGDLAPAAGSSCGNGAGAAELPLGDPGNGAGDHPGQQL